MPLFTTRRRVISQLKALTELRLAELGVELKDQQEYVEILKDPDKLEEYARENGLSLVDDEDLPQTVDEVIDHAHAHAAAHEDHVQRNEDDQKELEDEIAQAHRFLAILKTGDHARIAAELKSRAAGLRRAADFRHEQLSVVARATGNDPNFFARYYIPQARAEAEIMEQYAAMLLTEGSPPW